MRLGRVGLVGICGAAAFLILCPIRPSSGRGSPGRPETPPGLSCSTGPSSGHVLTVAFTGDLAAGPVVLGFRTDSAPTMEQGPLQVRVVAPGNDLGAECSSNGTIKLVRSGTWRADRLDIAYTGRPVERIGRPGQGPGEFEVPRSLFWIEDTLAVRDFETRRLSYFARDGTLEGDERRAGRPSPRTPGGRG